MIVLRPTQPTQQSIYLHYEVEAGAGDIIEVNLDADANVILLDDLNYNNYTRGIQFEYLGGLALTTPVHINIPFDGTWHLVIDFGGYSGVVKPKVNIIQPAFRGF